jgi:serine/threonine protein kinase
MAEVQLALQRGPAGFEKLVVVKLVHENLATQKAFVDMLLDEARVAALVKHPNVVDIYDLGEVDGRYFIAMEYLEGEPLLAVLRAGRDGERLDVLSTARLIADTAEGLDAAHELRSMAGEPIGLVHHDISLGNIVVLYNGQVKLVDFGVAKATQSATTRTKIQGKFGYMAPEKLRGGAGDRRSDIWSLGCVVWEALTLKRLFKGGNDSDTMQQVLEYPILAPSNVNGDVPADFDPIVMRALERDPNKRYATAKAMAAELEEVLRKHGYAAKNDAIAKYMQATFQSHIQARKKLLQEVSSKGGASPDVLEAAFNDGAVASGSPLISTGEFKRPASSVLPERTPPRVAASGPLVLPRANSDELARFAETERSPGHRAKPEVPDQRSEGSAEFDVRGDRMKYGLLAARPTPPATPAPPLAGKPIPPARSTLLASLAAKPTLPPPLTAKPPTLPPPFALPAQDPGDERTVVEPPPTPVPSEPPAAQAALAPLAAKPAPPAQYVGDERTVVEPPAAPSRRWIRYAAAAAVALAAVVAAVVVFGGSDTETVPSAAPAPAAMPKSLAQPGPAEPSAAPGPTESAQPLAQSRVQSPAQATGQPVDVGQVEVPVGADALHDGPPPHAASEPDTGKSTRSGPLRHAQGSKSASSSKPSPDKNSAEEVFKLGLQAWVRGDSRTAIASYKRVLQANPDYAAAWRSIGLVYEKTGEKAAARSAFQQYLKRAPDAADSASIRAKLESL